MLAGGIIGIVFKQEIKWLKYVLMTLLILVYAILDAAFTYTVAILIAIPTVMSSRYFLKKYTIYVALATYAAFFVSALWGANHGVLDLNTVQYPQGTVIRIGQSQWLREAVVGIYYDRALMMFNTLCFSYGPKFLVSLISTVGSVLVASQGHKMVLEQKRLTEESADVITELSTASRLQKDILPGVFPAFPDRKEFDIYASMTPALEVGGDFYDFFMVDDDHLAFVMGDVSDKGIPAAMFMIHAKNTIASDVMMGKSPAKALASANNTLAYNNNENMFVTVWLGILTISTGSVTVCNAGHEPAAIRRAGGEFEEMKETHGVAMGCLPNMEYEEYEVQLSPGDKIFLYTDGITEAMDAKLKLFGFQRMMDALNKKPDANPGQIIANMIAALKIFVKDAKQFDDITMLALEYKGN